MIIRNGIRDAFLYLLGALFILSRVEAYVPALPSNDSTLIETGVNQSDTSRLVLQWFPGSLAFPSLVLYLLGEPLFYCRSGNFLNLYHTNWQGPTVQE